MGLKERGKEESGSTGSLVWSLLPPNVQQGCSSSAGGGLGGKGASAANEQEPEKAAPASHCSLP